MANKPKGCFYCQYFYINPPIIREPYTCLKGAKQMPNIWTREEKVADDCPLVEVEQTKHGQWIPGKEIAKEFLAGNVIHVDYLNYYCSICRAVVSERETMMYHYCPNCGAKMDEDKNGR